MDIYFKDVIVVQSPNHLQLFATPWTAACQASPSLLSPKVCPCSCSLIPCSHLILWHPLLLLPPILPSIRDFSIELAVLISWPEYWSFTFSLSSSNDYSGFISDGFDLLAVQGTLGSPFQHHSSKASTLWHSAFSTVQFSQLSVTTGKTIALTIWTFVSKIVSLLFNTLSRFLTAFLPRSSHLLISWLQSPSALILEPKKRKSVTTSTFSPSICHEVMELDAMILVFFFCFFFFSIFNFKPTLELFFFPSEAL